MDITVGRKAIAEATEKLKNWGRWGTDDQVGTLNHITPEDIVRAAGLIRIGKVFALGIPLDSHGRGTFSLAGCRKWRSPSLSHGQHCARGGSDDPLRNAAQKQMGHARTPVRAHDDQVDRCGSSVIDDFNLRISSSNDALDLEGLSLLQRQRLVETRPGFAFEVVKQVLRQRHIETAGVRHIRIRDQVEQVE